MIIHELIVTSLAVPPLRTSPLVIRALRWCYANPLQKPQAPTYAQVSEAQAHVQAQAQARAAPTTSAPAASPSLSIASPLSASLHNAPEGMPVYCDHCKDLNWLWPKY